MQTFGKFRPTSFDTRGMGSTGREDWLVVPVSHTRDSGPFEESNFATAEKMLREVAPEHYDEDDNPSGDWEVCRFGHWGPGWFEIIVVRPGSPAALVAAKIEEKLEDYPLLDEDDYSEREWESAAACWEMMSLSERVELCQKNRVSVFAARHDYIPQDDNGGIFEACRAEG